MSRPVVFVLCCVLLASPVFAEADPSADDMARRIFRPPMPKNTLIGIVVGTLVDGKKTIRTYGNAKFDGDTVFEIGSVSKVFTSLALATLVDEGAVKLSDPIQKYLPPGVSAPSKIGKEIRLVHLATHTAGLPRLPPNMTRLRLLFQSSDPYASFTADQLYEAVRKTTLHAEPGTHCVYSNYGVGLLGHLLTRVAKTDYESLIKQRICKPLGMSDTVLRLTDQTRSRLAPGHSALGIRTSNWGFDALAGCGAIRSTANDLLLFLDECISPANKKLAKPIESTLVKRHKMPPGDTEIGLGWILTNLADVDMCWHNGGTGGYASFVGMVRPARIGVVILCNAGLYGQITQMGFKRVLELIQNACHGPVVGRDKPSCNGK